jgi:hypothetical protein
MKKLENQFINRLNKVLHKYNLTIISKINHKYKTTIEVDSTLKKYCYEYNLVEIKDNIIIDCYFTWVTIERMLLESTHVQSLFSIINGSRDSVKYFTDRNIEPIDQHVLIAKLYNKLGFLNNCSSYEELAIRMDLIGI